MMRGKLLQALVGGLTKNHVAGWQPLHVGVLANTLVNTPLVQLIPRCLHTTVCLDKKRHGKKRSKKVDDCSGHHARRHQGFNKPCPPPECKCPPGTTWEEQHQNDDCDRMSRHKKPRRKKKKKPRHH